MKTTRFLWIAICILLLTGCGTGSPSAEPTPDVSEAVFNPVVNATGVVVPAQWATLSMGTPGLLETLLAAEGDTVQQGQVIARLQGSETLQANRTAAELELVAAQQALDTLQKNADVARAQAQLTLAQAEKEYDRVKKRRASKAFTHGDQEKIDTARANLILAQDAVKKAEEEWSYFADKDEEDTNRAYALAQLAATRQNRDKTLADFNYLIARPDAIEVAVAEGELQVAITNLEKAKSDYQKLKDGPDPEQLKLAQTRITNAQTQQKAAQKAINDLELRAPFAGTLSKVYVRANEWINPGQPLVLMADLGTLQVETTDLNEIDMAQITLGAPVNVTFDALPNLTLQGKVTHIAPKSSESSGVNYTVVVQLNQIPEQLRWGMTAFVDIQKTTQEAQ